MYGHVCMYVFHLGYFLFCYKHGFRFTLTAYDIDSEVYDDQLIDVVHLILEREPSVSSEFSSPLLLTGLYGIGEAGLSYRVMCMDGYCGSNCSQICDPQPVLSNANFTSTDPPSTSPTESEGFQNPMFWAVVEGRVCLSFSLQLALTPCLCWQRWQPWLLCVLLLPWGLYWLVLFCAKEWQTMAQKVRHCSIIFCVN